MCRPVGGYVLPPAGQTLKHYRETMLTVALPRELTNQSVAKAAHAEESVCVILETKTNAFNPWRFQARGSAVYIFEYDSKRRAHVFKCPMTVWEANEGKIAKDVFNSPLLKTGRVTIVPRVEAWKPPLKRTPVVQRRFGTEATRPQLPAISNALPATLHPDLTDPPPRDLDNEAQLEGELERELGELDAVE